MRAISAILSRLTRGDRAHTVRRTVGSMAYDLWAEGFKFFSQHSPDCPTEAPWLPSYRLEAEGPGEGAHGGLFVKGASGVY